MANLGQFEVFAYRHLHFKGSKRQVSTPTLFHECFGITEHAIYISLPRSVVCTSTLQPCVVCPLLFVESCVECRISNNVLAEVKVIEESTQSEALLFLPIGNSTLCLKTCAYAFLQAAIHDTNHFSSCSYLPPMSSP